MYKERKDIGSFVEVDFAEFAIRGLLMQRDPGTLMVDVDGTVKNIASVGLVPLGIMLNLSRLVEKGWQIMVVTNQSTKGHMVARCLGNLFDLPNYPDCFLERGWPVFGGKWDFLWNHYKEGSRSISEVSNKVIESRNLGYVVMMGDKEGDIAFFNRLVSEIRKRGCERGTMFLKLPFLGIVGFDGVMSRRLEAILP